ncbi:olfactory receptor 8U3-like [Rhinophrynus dorsalis]
MEEMNQTLVTYFIIKGITDRPELQFPIFFVVLFIYIFTLASNMAILIIVLISPLLHTPMYFFLINLSLIDMSCSTVTLHKVLLNFITGDKIVYFTPCIAQVCTFAGLASDELLMLTAMSYDRYVAICHPLHYHTIMNRRVCVLLASVCWVWGFIENIPFTFLLSRFSCYKSIVINHFYCDLIPLLKLTCSDTYIMEIFIFTEGVSFLFITPFTLTFISYVYIIAAILRISSSTGRRKAFYTCSSHLTVVILLYAALGCQYLGSTLMKNTDSNKFFSLFNTAAVPMLNPLIYSLKNKDVKSSLKRKLK